MARELEFDLPISPWEVLTRLKDETVSFEDVMSMNAPVKGYTTFLKESFTGDKTVLAKIDGPEFRLMCIGIAPIKGQSATAPVGTMHGLIEPLNFGSRIRARFKIAISFVVWGASSVVSLVFALVASGYLLTLAGELEEKAMMLLGCAFLGFISIVTIVYIRVGARTQTRLLSEFLEAFAKKQKR